MHTKTLLAYDELYQMSRATNLRISFTSVDRCTFSIIPSAPEPHRVAMRIETDYWLHFGSEHKRFKALDDLLECARKKAAKEMAPTNNEEIIND